MLLMANGVKPGYNGPPRPPSMPDPNPKNPDRPTNRDPVPNGERG